MDRRQLAIDKTLATLDVYVSRAAATGGRFDKELCSLFSTIPVDVSVDHITNSDLRACIGQIQDAVRTKDPARFKQCVSDAFEMRLRFMKACVHTLDEKQA